MSSKTVRDLEAQLRVRQQALEEARERLAQAEREVNALTIAIEIMRNVEESAEEAAPPKALRNEMVEILRDEGKSLHYSEIFDRLTARGIAVSGKDPKRNVGAHLSNDDRFESLGNGEWGLASWRQRPSSHVVSLRGRVHAMPTMAQTQSPPWDDEPPDAPPPLEEDGEYEGTYSQRNGTDSFNDVPF